MYCNGGSGGGGGCSGGDGGGRDSLVGNLGTPFCFLFSFLSETNTYIGEGDQTEVFKPRFLNAPLVELAYRVSNRMPRGIYRGSFIRSVLRSCEVFHAQINSLVF